MTKSEAIAEAARLSKETGGRYYPFRHGLGAWKVKERYVTPDKSADAERTTLPTDPCFKCGARGWCKHRQPEPQAVADMVDPLRNLISNPAIKIEPKLSAEDTVRLMRSKGWTI